MSVVRKTWASLWCSIWCSVSDILVDFGGAVARFISRHERLCLLVAVAISGSTATYRAYTTPLWFDEFFTLFIARLSSFSEMVRGIPADGQPPLNYLLTHVFIRLFGETELGLRLPAIICYLATGLITYKIVRRHGTPAQALFALVFVYGSWMSAEQAIIARPYELLAMCTALTFSFWQVAAAKERRRFFSLCGVGVGVAGCVLSHYFGVIYAGLFLLVGETVRTIQRRKFDTVMMAAIGAGLLPVAFTLSLAHQTEALLGEPVRRSVNFWAKPSAINLTYYFRMVPPELVLFVLLFGVLMLGKHKHANDEEAVPGVPAYEWAAAGALSLLFPVLLAVAFVKTGYFQPKYAIGTSMGLAFAMAWGVPRIAFLRRTAQPLLALCTLAFLLVSAKDLLWLPVHQSIRPQQTKNAFSPVLLSAPGDLPIVVANAFDYLPEWWYSPLAVRERLVYLADRAFAIRQTDFLPELSLALDNRYAPMPVADYAAFIDTHEHFLLLASGNPRLVWVPARLQEAGWRLTMIAKSGQDSLYQVDRNEKQY
jgi:hypothetical protein